MCSRPERRDSPVYSSPESCFENQGVILQIFQEHAITFTEIIIQKIDCGLRYLPYDFRFISEKGPYLRNSNWLSSDEHTGESIMNMNNSKNIWQNEKAFLGVSIGGQKTLFDEKREDKKSLDSVLYTTLMPYLSYEGPMTD
jgi:hypothetical protein